MLDVFLEVVLPVAVIAALGGVVGGWLELPSAVPSALVFYLFSPALVFQSLANTQLSAQVSLRIVAVIVVTFTVVYVAASIWSIARGHEPALRAGFALGATSPNLGNMGLPVALLAFGEAGLEVAIINFVAGAVLMQSVGIAIASTAGGSRSQALRAPFRYPFVYAAAAGAATNALALDLPVSVRAAVESLAAAAIPTMLVVLGLHIRNVAGRDRFADLIAINAGRLVIAPAAAWLGAGVLGLNGVTRNTLVVLAAMPVAVMTTILATEFQAQPTFLARAVVTSTLTSILTLTILIAWIR